ncbi:MAG: hypothetical protein JO101_07190, partial [Candidatus Eremiobacteraeota bacterium]|nr:hypothetical protein [Candidatus Eremiobacteraeota bacterium]
MSYLDLAERAIRQGISRFRNIADNLPVLIWESGTDKLCTWFNTTGLSFVGRSIEQEIGDGGAENVPADDFDR